MTTDAPKPPPRHPEAPNAVIVNDRRWDENNCRLISATWESRPCWRLTRDQAELALGILHSAGARCWELVRFTNHPNPFRAMRLTPDAVGHIPPGYSVEIETVDSQLVLQFVRNATGTLSMNLKGRHCQLVPDSVFSTTQQQKGR